MTRWLSAICVIAVCVALGRPLARSGRRIRRRGFRERLMGSRSWMRRRRGRLTARWIFQESGSSQDLGAAVVAPGLVLVVAALRVRRQLPPLPLPPPIQTPSPDHSSSRSPGAEPTSRCSRGPLS